MILLRWLKPLEPPPGATGAEALARRRAGDPCRLAELQNFRTIPPPTNRFCLLVEKLDSPV